MAAKPGDHKTVQARILTGAADRPAGDATDLVPDRVARNNRWQFILVGSVP
jgi:hypothetical protein